MKNIFQFAFAAILLLASSVVNAQFTPEMTCGTESPTEANFKYLEMIGEKYRLGIERVSETQINIPVKIHIVRDLNGNSYDYNTMLTVMCELNQKFESSGIHFYLKGDVNIITNSNYFRHTSNATGTQLMLEYNQVRVVNIYFVNLSAIGLCGYAYFPGSGPGGVLSQGGLMMSIPCSQVGNTTLAHEMGHYLALPHPFDGTSNNPQDVFAERVTRNTNEVAPRLPANCATFGDRFCDTPADFVSYRWNCNTTPSDTDLNGDAFVPDPTLFMSYSSDFCMNRFSPEQINTMRFTMLGDSNSSAPRGYLIVFPMPPYDTIPSTAVALEPVAATPPSPANWIYFRWSEAPRATHYLLRIRLGNSLVYERIVQDTSYLHTINNLQANQTYTYTIRPYNHGYTCMAPSQQASFSTTAAYGVSVFDQAKTNLSVYPSLLTAGERLNIRATDMGLTSLSVTDQHGKLILEQALDAQEDLHQLQLPSLAAGMYFIRLNGASGAFFERIVVR